jgi:hypothetical protein
MRILCDLTLFHILCPLHVPKSLSVTLSSLAPSQLVCQFVPSHPRFTDEIFSWVYLLYIALLFIVDT